MIRDANGNTYAGYPDNRAGRRRFDRDQRRGRLQPFSLPSLSIQPRAGRSVLAALTLVVSMCAVLCSTGTFGQQLVDLIERGLSIASGGVATTYYVDFVNGSDANNGLGPDASAVTNKPWKTIGKLLGAAGMASGDTAYLSPAGPFREVVTVAMTSAVAETKILGDPMNIQGFKTSGGVRVTPGQVQWTAYTTNDKTLPSSTSLLSLAGRDFLTFQNILFVGGSAGSSGGIVLATTATSTNITFRDCAFIAWKGPTGSKVFNITVGFAVSAAWTIDRCYIDGMTNTPPILITLTTGVGSDYDSNILIENCFFVGASNAEISITNSGTSANKGGGVDVRNCTYIGSSTFVQTTAAQISTTIPCTVDNCLILSGGANAALNAGTSGQITEDYNLINAPTPRTNVTAGTHSISDCSYAPLWSFGQERLFTLLPRTVGMPWINSPILGFGGDGSQTAYDLTNRPRPAGGASANPAAGALERSNTFITDPSPIGGGGTAIKVTGPAYAEFYVPVPARAITISVVVKWDATYAGTKPQLQIDANGRIGVAAETKTATGGSGSNETLTLSAFTPTRAGDMVVVRVISNDTNGGGLLQVDDFSVTG